MALNKTLILSWKVVIFYLFLHKNICFGYSLEVPHWGTSNEYPQHRFFREIIKNISLDTPIILGHETDSVFFSYLKPLKRQEQLHMKMSSVYVICWIFLQTFQTYFCIQANSVDPDQTAPKGAVWSGSTLFAKMTFKIISRWQSRRQ